MERIDANMQMLKERLPMPCWGRLPYRPQPDPAMLAASLCPWQGMQTAQG
ncbi:hypothetical protein XTG29_01676 [Xanthomonas translucens pv. graminis ART-Xtg29]|nr:hypothetical protein XTG29_01676 [Xanthomonas translucens pv. graminis ART-Xtg29]